jgi:DNA-binding NarL/FixJ family response regulator
MGRAAVDLVGDDAAGVGYLLKDRVTDIDAFIDVVHRVAAGASALDPEVVSRMLGRQGIDAIQALTPREREVLGLRAEGRSNRGIAEAFVITEDAVEKHVKHILRKLNITKAASDHRRVLAVLAYLRRERQ